MTNEQIECLRQALLTVERREIRAYEQLNDPIPPYSKQFERKMEKLFRAERRRTWSIFKTGRRRVFFAVCVLIMIFVMTLSVSATRKPIFSAFERITDKFTQIILPKSNHNDSFTEYQPDWIPEQYELYSHSTTGTFSRTEWCYSGNYICLDQISSASIHINTENTTIQKVTWGEREITYFQKYNNYHFSWTEDGYFFMLACPSDLPLSDIQRMLESLHPAGD